MDEPKFVLTPELRKTIKQDKELSEIIHNTVYGSTNLERFFELYNQVKNEHDHDIADAYLHIYNDAVMIMLNRNYFK